MKREARMMDQLAFAVRLVGYGVIWGLLIKLALATVDDWSWAPVIIWGLVFMFIGPWLNPFNRAE